MSAPVVPAGAAETMVPFAGAREKVDVIFNAFRKEKRDNLTMSELKDLLITTNPELRIQTEVVYKHAEESAGLAFACLPSISLDALYQLYTEGGGDVNKDFVAVWHRFHPEEPCPFIPEVNSDRTLNLAPGVPHSFWASLLGVLVAPPVCPDDGGVTHEEAQVGDKEVSLTKYGEEKEDKEEEEEKEEEEKVEEEKEEEEKEEEEKEKEEKEEEEISRTPTAKAEAESEQQDDVKEEIPIPEAPGAPVVPVSCQEAVEEVKETTVGSDGVETLAAAPDPLVLQLENEGGKPVGAELLMEAASLADKVAPRWAVRVECRVQHGSRDQNLILELLPMGDPSTATVGSKSPHDVGARLTSTLTSGQQGLVTQVVAKSGPETECPATTCPPTFPPQKVLAGDAEPPSACPALVTTMEVDTERALGHATATTKATHISPTSEAISAAEALVGPAEAIQGDPTPIATVLGVISEGEAAGTTGSVTTVSCPLTTPQASGEDGPAPAAQAFMQDINMAPVFGDAGTEAPVLPAPTHAEVPANIQGGLEAGPPTSGTPADIRSQEQIFASPDVLRTPAIATEQLPIVEGDRGVPCEGMETSLPTLMGSNGLHAAPSAYTTVLPAMSNGTVLSPGVVPNATTDSIPTTSTAMFRPASGGYGPAAAGVNVTVPLLESEHSHELSIGVIPAGTSFVCPQVLSNGSAVCSTSGIWNQAQFTPSATQAPAAPKATVGGKDIDNGSLSFYVSRGLTVGGTASLSGFFPPTTAPSQSLGPAAIYPEGPGSVSFTRTLSTVISEIVLASTSGYGGFLKCQDVFSAEDKLEIIFDCFDKNEDGNMTKDDLKLFLYCVEPEASDLCVGSRLERFLCEVSVPETLLLTRKQFVDIHKARNRDVEGDFLMVCDRHPYRVLRCAAATSLRQAGVPFSPPKDWLSPLKTVLAKMQADCKQLPPSVLGMVRTATTEQLERFFAAHAARRQLGAHSSAGYLAEPVPLNLALSNATATAERQMERYIAQAVSGQSQVRSSGLGVTSGTTPDPVTGQSRGMPGSTTELQNVQQHDLDVKVQELAKKVQLLTEVLSEGLAHVTESAAQPAKAVVEPLSGEVKASKGARRAAKTLDISTPAGKEEKAPVVTEQINTNSPVPVNVEAADMSGRCGPVGLAEAEKMTAVAEWTINSSGLLTGKEGKKIEREKCAKAERAEVQKSCHRKLEQKSEIKPRSATPCVVDKKDKGVERRVEPEPEATCSPIPRHVVEEKDRKKVERRSKPEIKRAGHHQEKDVHPYHRGEVLSAAVGAQERLKKPMEERSSKKEVEGRCVPEVQELLVPEVEVPAAVDTQDKPEVRRSERRRRKEVEGRTRSEREGHALREVEAPPAAVDMQDRHEGGRDDRYPRGEVEKVEGRGRSEREGPVKERAARSQRVLAERQVVEVKPSGPKGQHPAQDHTSRPTTARRAPKSSKGPVQDIAPIPAPTPVKVARAPAPILEAEHPSPPSVNPRAARNQSLQAPGAGSPIRPALVKTKAPPAASKLAQITPKHQRPSPTYRPPTAQQPMAEAVNDNGVRINWVPPCPGSPFDY